MATKEEYIRASFKRIEDYIKSFKEEPLGPFGKSAILVELKTMFDVGKGGSEKSESNISGY